MQSAEDWILRYINNLPFSITHLAMTASFCHIITQTNKTVGLDRKEQTEERFLPFPLIWLLAAGAMVTLYDVK